ncbi:MAG: nuclear mRNA export, poly(A)+RNA binding protein [Phylliscum demangeonii]|nr:MAG: nuclear mRNA export, poly(A)+RNA binding protein [Phylliscum demangeonii]
MLTSTAPRGYDGRGGSHGSKATQPASRGGIRKNRVSLRVDRDGDLDMDAVGGGAGARGRGGRGPNRNNLADRTNGGGVRTRSAVSSGGARGLLNGAALQKAIARGMAPTDKGSSRPLRMESLIKEVAGMGKSTKRPGRQVGLDQIKVVGLKESKALSNPDGGVKTLLGFLERKATGLDTSAGEGVRIRKSRVEGDAVIVSVKTEDTPKILRLNQYTFAGAVLHVSKYGGSIPTQPDLKPTQDTRQRLTEALLRRYNPAVKLLDLSALSKDPELVRMGAFNQSSTAWKLFPALMRICDTRFANAQQKQDAVVSVSLANNELRSISLVTMLAQSFPGLRNLDLSHNKLEHTSALAGWRWRFRSLEHLVLSGNPIERVEPNYQADIMRWYPSLRVINGVQVRTDQEIAALAASEADAAKGKTPLPIQPALFLDESHVAENFLKQFLPEFDRNRRGLVEQYYDEQSTFSLNVNTAAPRAPQHADHADAIKPQVWDAYIRKSRNLLKIHHLPARIARAYVGVASIQQCWSALPASRHADIFTEPEKWLVECQPVPGLPDPTGQSVGGVGGLMVMVHGEFDEMVEAGAGAASTGTVIKRSFDRTFVLGPGGRTGIRVLSDMLTYRAYGGYEAWMPEMGSAMPMAAASVEPSMAMSMSMTPDVQLQQQQEQQQLQQHQQEAMILELSNRTGMTLPYSRLCLEEKGWVFEEAMMAFESVRAQLPAEAWNLDAGGL